MMDSANFLDTLSGQDLSEVLRKGARRLTAAGIHSARLDAEVLLGHVLAMTREQLTVATKSPLSAEQASRFETLLERRLRREPVAYITGRKEFWSLDFLVTPDVLIPRSETELVIEVALSLTATLAAQRPLRIIEIGTGSGAIAVSLARELTRARVWATDISLGALAVGRYNARLNGVAERVGFMAGDLFTALSARRQAFDLIVSNPPYIRRDEIATLEVEVNQWEPRAALDGGPDGLEFYRRMAGEAWQFLTPGGAMVMEIGAGTARAVLAIMNQSGRYRDLGVIEDYAGKDRVVVARNTAPRPPSN
jgi:release factor glutamine methyltransferase